MKARISSATGWMLIVSLATLTAFMAWTARNRPVILDETDAVIERRELPDMRIDINTANAAELSVLPGLGPLLAERIVDDRAANGPFASLDDLDRVSGIGASILERIKPYAVVAEAKP